MLQNIACAIAICVVILLIFRDIFTGGKDD